MATKKKPEPEPTTVEGFTTSDYEGLELLVCDRCGFDTFSVDQANAHRDEHGQQDARTAELDDITEHLAERAQVTEGGA